MKTKLFLTAAIAVLSISALAQTKGTNTVGFGVNVYTEKQQGTNGENKTNNNLFTLSYGNFIADNSKIGVEISYGKTDYNYQIYASQESKNYGVSITYQKYFPLVKTLYAYAGARGGYIRGKSEINNSDRFSTASSNTYSAAGYGGITWFLSKRFAFETSLLSATASYSETHDTEGNISNFSQDRKQKYFNVTTDGFINDLGFKIYLLF